MANRRRQVPEELRPEGRTDALARAVRRRRSRLGLRQEEVADLAGCSERFVHSLENGKPTLRLDKVLDVLAVLGLELVVTAGAGGLTEGGSRADEEEAT